MCENPSAVWTAALRLGSAHTVWSLFNTSLRSPQHCIWAMRLQYGEGVGPLDWGPLVTALSVSSLLQEGQQLWRSHAAEEPEPAERLTDTVRPAAGYDVFHALPLAPGLLPAAVPTAGRQQTLKRVSA